MDEPSAFNQGCKAIVPRSAILDSRFLNYALRSGKEELQLAGRGTTFVEVNANDVESFEIPLPPLDEQRRIADYLDHETAEIDALIADLENVQKMNMERRFAELGQKIVYPNEFNVETILAPHFVPLKRVGEISLGKMLDTKKPREDELNAPYLRAANVQPLGELALEDVKRMRFTKPEIARLDLRKGDVVVVEGGVGGYGRAAYLNSDLDSVGFQNSIIRIRANEDWEGRFITYALILLRDRGFIESVASVTSMPHFTTEKVAVTPIPAYPKRVQTQIVDELDETWNRQNEVARLIEDTIQLARERRAALISAAVIGQIDVTEKRTPVAEELESTLAEA